MQSNCPADHELLAFFGVEPKVLDPSVPWFHNTLDFEVERQGFVVQCRLADGDIDARLRFGEMELARFELQRFKSLRFYVKAEGELLVATFDRGQGEETFSLMLKPHVWLGLGNLQGIPPAP